jgi:hypothetical protein
METKIEYINKFILIACSKNNVEKCFVKGFFLKCLPEDFLDTIGIYGVKLTEKYTA